jgi:alpha-mannosidase
MIKNVENIFTVRIDKFQDRITKQILSDSIPFKASYYKSKNQVLFGNRLDGEYTPINIGEVWGEAWDNAWFYLKGDIPKSWKNKKVVASLDFTGEGLIFNNGVPVQGITSSSVYNKDFKRDTYTISENCKGGEEIELWIEAVAIGYLGINLPFDPKPNDSDRYGEFKSTVNKISFAIFDEELWHLWLDIEVLNGMIKHLPVNSVRRSRIIRNVNKAIDHYGDNPGNSNSARLILQEELSKKASSSDLSVSAIGHAHIDTAWLWPVSETIRKCARSFSNQIALLDKYPEYIFGASQPQHYVFVKEHYPEIFEKIKQFVNEGRWEVQGGMWVEADTNLISGESMIRQIIHGKNFFMDEFGIDVKNLWLPDVFGYSASLPQILKKSGIDYFLTQKISWNQINEFPHNTFSWRGIDGTEILTHFPPENNYNSYLSPEYLIPGRENFKEKDFIDEFISLFGVGDGGGGPKSENIEFGKRMSNLEGVPKVRFGRADSFFESLNKYKNDLPVWGGELYLELHRGTLTSQALVKKTNRQLEMKLRELEILYSCLPLENYPSQEFEAIWKKVLINQFHDIIPGSSIKDTYKVTHKEYEEALESCIKLEHDASQLLFEESENSLVLFNSLSYKFSGAITLPDNWEYSLIDSENKKVEVQKEGDNLIVFVSVQPLSFLTLYKSAKYDAPVVSNRDLILENDKIRYEFDEDGNLIKAYDKELELNVLADGERGNILSLYDDHPLEWDAWDVEVFYETSHLENAKGLQSEIYGDGKVRKGLKFVLEIGQSKIQQKVFLLADSKRLDFDTEVDWNEKHKMLRVAFPVNVFNSQASFDIQYGFINRNTHRNTSWDFAKFEVCGHRYADISREDFGIALLNNSKYGYKVLNNTIDLNLLRSPSYPDPDADMGNHKFTYSLLPHKGNLTNSNVISEAAQLNQGIMIFPGVRNIKASVPCSVEGKGISLETIKKAEKSECLIIRIVEINGSNSRGSLKFSKYPVKVSETNLIEWEEKEEHVILDDIELRLKPFEIRTYKVRIQ